MSNIDLHNHVIPENVVQAIKREPEKFATRIEEKGGKRYFDNHGRVAELLPEFCDADAKVAWLDRVGLDVAVVSVGPPIYFYGLKPDAGLEAAKLANDGIAQMVERYPDRLRGMAHLPMQDPHAAIAELERVVKEHRFKGVELATSIEGVPLADPKFRKVLKTIEQLGCFVFAHPYQCLAHGGMDAYYLHNFVGFPLDTTLMIAHLMFSGALDDLKTLRILCAHGGGFMPYQIGRFMHGYNVRAEPKAHTQATPEGHFRRFYFDSLTHHPQATRHLIDMAGADRIVIGTDHPFDMGPADPLAAIDAIPGLTAGDRERICELTARGLLGED
ncbi:MAG: amidohydrolase [Betaproteobacteria bacterium]|nr:amidohydrolase [Betaproteobacteria bacterium]MDH3437853.1 amidohydrolase [Betaproteobacteria bacterium]